MTSDSFMLQFSHVCICCFWGELVFRQVLLMQWNSHFPWEKAEFDFLDMFSGASNVSRVWCYA